MTGSQRRPASSWVMLAVWMARVSTEVCTMSGCRPEAASSLPPLTASCAPTSDRPTSTQPVNRPLEFHSLSPCRSSTRVFMVTKPIGGTGWGLTGLLRACSEGALAGSRPSACTPPRWTSRVPVTPAGSTSTWSRCPSAWPSAASRSRSSPARSAATRRRRSSWPPACWSATWSPGPSRSSTRTPCPARSASSPSGCCAPRPPSRPAGMTCCTRTTGCPARSPRWRRSAGGCPWCSPCTPWAR